MEAGVDRAEVSVLDAASVALARTVVRDLAAARGLSDEFAETVALVASELGWNQLRHAASGHMTVRAIERDGVPGLEVIARDAGPGIADPTAALAGAPSANGGLGGGLPGVRRLSDEVDFDVRWGERTRVWARKFAAPVRRRAEVAILGRGLERVSGDDGAFLRGDDALLLAVAYGLGHGVAAREASLAAVEVVEALPGDGEPAAILEACDGALADTRGAALAVVRLDERRGELAAAAVGDLAARVYGKERIEHLTPIAGVVGAPARRWRARVERLPVDADDLIVVFTDGLTERAHFADPLVRRQPPLVIAHHLLRHFGRAHDDALVLVARV